MNWIVYKTNSGKILRIGSCPEDTCISLQARDGETVIEGVASIDDQYILNGEITDYTPEQLLAKRAVPYGYAWDIATMSTVKVAEDSEITAYLATQARTKRDRLLASTEWTQTIDQPKDRQLLWQPYRQMLRDIPQQKEFPHTINWPEKPA